MCYSAQVWESYQKYVRAFGATIDLPEFLRLYGARAQGEKVKIPKGVDDSFRGATAGIEGQIWTPSSWTPGSTRPVPSLRRYKPS